MTLKEKFDNVEICIESQLLNLRYDENMKCVEECEQIADDFAIGFAEFLINYNYHPIHKVWIRYDKMANEKYTTKELLEIYKKEKGL
jgi:hypothetical protein